MTRYDSEKAGLLLGVVVAAPLLFICIFAAGAGHGTYLPAKIFFPITMLSCLLFSSITAPFAIFAVLQFPLYGLILGHSKSHGRSAFIRTFLISVHIALSLLAIFLVNIKDFP